MDVVKVLTKEFNLKESQVQNTLNLIDEGNTIPFIARYRKEMTGGLSDEVLRDLSERLIYLRNLYARKDEVKRLIEEQGNLTEEIAKNIEGAKSLQEVEDIYRPFKPKRRTRATKAKEKGLEPLAKTIYEQEIEKGSLEDLAANYIDEEKDVHTLEDALTGASDIIAEWVSDNPKHRKKIRDLTFKEGIMESKAAKKEDSVYEMYYEYAETIKTLPPHRVLAMNRGEKEEFLKVKVQMDTDKVLRYLEQFEIKNSESVGYDLLKAAIEDSYKRLIEPSIEREIRSDLTETAEEKAIKVFGENLKALLLQPPISGKVVMGYDPAFRTGCKVAVVDDTGKLLEYQTLYPTAPQNKVDAAKKTMKEMIKKHNIEIIAIGNGTASRESEQIVADMISEMEEKVYYMIVNEAGASVYSASKIAQQEYPDIDVSIRGAISIARRIQDPLAELVKIDPKHIGVGQYQHDVNQKRLDEALKGVVEDAVNAVGVDLNTASASLLEYISGISKAVAKNIALYREENGRFTDRKQLKKVARLGPQAFVQSAGFLRIYNGKNPLDRTSVHPESYKAAEGLLDALDYDWKKGEMKAFTDIKERLKTKDKKSLAAELEIGLPTLEDIADELQKPGRDPREDIQKPILKTDVLKLEDLEEGMVLTGTVRNVIDFGAFVDIGLKNDGLVHISKLSNKYVKNPMDVVSVGDIVKVKVVDIDLKRGRVGLSMKDV
ncbi:Tex family protein [Isachenkonia alkalipeptolytica]|uniref:RNA-binding transcriptional accessory protein n=1 Tax=Isachenkonia alkalipeptolytica TaxID=2565777 RepID=A0AA44BEL1_9CLOT|nr:Tex family protein [Isachenkonia alkalipeptolytica]NBG89384.1 RNA-binding transcriptional accessory protein [Isachenkonia alkalipeptolytica]